VLRAVVPVALALGGCNWALGIHNTEPSDAVTADAADRLLKPPPGPTTCGPAPDIDSWTFANHTVTGTTGVIHPTFLANDRVLFMFQGRLYESGLDADPQLAIDPGQGSMLFAPAAAPGGDVAWFLRSTTGVGGGGVYYMVRDGATWREQPADLGLVGYQIQTGAAGFYNGTVRMVAGFQPTSAVPMTLVELSSPDGEHWTRVDDPSWPDITQAYDPALSNDGCILMFASPSGLYITARDATGHFPEPHLITPLAGSEFSSQPALTPALDRLWFNDTMLGLIERRP
jgi:hypothetical protein